MSTKKNYIKFLILSGKQSFEIDQITRIISSPEFMNMSKLCTGEEFMYKCKDSDTLNKLLDVVQNSEFDKENELLPSEAVKNYIELITASPDLPLVAINPNNIIDFFNLYKLSFRERWSFQCGQKWDVLNHAQNVWNIKSRHFDRMWNNFVSMPFSFAVKDWSYAITLIHLLAKQDKDSIKSMFKNLLSEDKSLQFRIEEFAKQSKLVDIDIYNVFGQSYQNLDTITMYLWMIAPNKYFFYDYKSYYSFADKVGLSWLPLENKFNNNFKYIIDFFTQVKEYIKQDSDLLIMHNDCLGEERDMEIILNLLTLDFIQFVANIPEN